MKLRNGRAIVETMKDLVELIKMTTSIDYTVEDDYFWTVIKDRDLISYPVVSDDGRQIEVSEPSTSYDLMEHVESVGAWRTWAVNIGGVEFELMEKVGVWEACDSKAFAALPMGYDEEEMDALLGEFEDCGVDNIGDYVLHLVDDVMDINQGAEYEDLRTFEDDVDEVYEQLNDLGYEGYYELGDDIYGWVPGAVDDNDDEITKDDLMDAETAAKELVMNTYGWSFWPDADDD